MKLWTEDEIIHLEGYKGRYLNKTASKRFFELYEDVISNELKDSYILVSDAEKIYEQMPRKFEKKEIYKIVKSLKPLTTNGINKIKCTMLMGVGVLCYLTMTNISHKDKEKVINNLTKTFNQYIDDNQSFNEIKKKILDFEKYFSSLG